MVAFNVAVGMAVNRQQTLEIGLINYLWPSLTLLFAIPLFKLKPRWWLWPGVILAFFGVIWVVSSGDKISPALLMHNIRSNPIAYLLSLTAALSWAGYSNLVRYLKPLPGTLPLFFGISATFL